MRYNTDKWTKIIKDYVAHNRGMPTQTLARMIRADYPDSPTLMLIRQRIQYYIGQHGNFHRQKLSDTSLVRPSRPAGANFIGEIMEPERMRDSSPYVLRGQHILVLADLHMPFHDKVAIEAAVAYARRHAKVDTILIDGDLLDHYSLSFFNHTCDPMMLGRELESAKAFLAFLRHKWPKAQIVWKEGNHEERFKMTLNERAPEIADALANFTFKHAGCEEYHIDMVIERRAIYAGHLTILHGHELRGGMATPVSPARTTMLKCGDQTLVGHWHATSQQRNRTIRGNFPASWSIGCLCDLAPEYAPYNNWNHGFAIVHREGPDNFMIDNRTILDGKVV